MKQSLVFMIILHLILMIPTISQAIDLSILFIGNSHTYTNGLPSIIANLADAGGHNLYVEQSTVGSSTLSYHSHYQPTLDQIEGGDWDLVVLQEHSLLSVIEHLRENSFYPKVAWFDSLITSLGSQTVLFMHQAREFPEGSYCINEYCSRIFEDYFDMQEEMSAAYYPITSELDAVLVPVGEIWAEALRDDQTLQLWSTDNLHASLDGSYLTACVFYLYLFNESPYGLEYYGNLNQATALMYQQFALQYSKPKNLQISYSSNSQIHLTWESNLKSGFNIYSSDSPNSEFPGEWIQENDDPVRDTFWNSVVSNSRRFYRITVIR